MLHLLVRALRAHGRPEALYLDNGATYIGEQLSQVCLRLNITLLHANPRECLHSRRGVRRLTRYADAAGANPRRADWVAVAASARRRVRLTAGPVNRR